MDDIKLNKGYVFNPKDIRVILFSKLLLEGLKFGLHMQGNSRFKIINIILVRKLVVSATRIPICKLINRSVGQILNLLVKLLSIERLLLVGINETANK